MSLISSILKAINSKKEGKQSLSKDELIDRWCESPETYFKGQYGAELKWKTFRGDHSKAIDGYGWSKMPDIVNSIQLTHDNDYPFGYIERFDMVGGGIVRVEHFALSSNLTHRGLGIVFFNALLEFFKQHNAITVEFHEDHRTKIEHYKRFFEKNNITEIQEGVWKVELYEGTGIPQSVLDFQKSLYEPVK